MMNRLVLMKVHAVLAAFVLPVAVMFMVTGSLYTLGVKGGYTDDVYEVALGEPLEAKLGVLEDFARMELDQRTISVPEGQPRLKVYGGHFLLEWTGSSKDVIVEPTDNALVAKLTVKHASWYRNLVQLH